MSEKGRGRRRRRRVWRREGTIEDELDLAAQVDDVSWTQRVLRHLLVIH